MKSILKLGTILLALSFAGSCNEYWGLVVDCSECYWDKPDSADLTIHLTINEQHPEVPIVLYRGNIEDGQVDWVDTARETPYILYSAVDQFYSLTARYRVDGKTIVVVDGDKLEAKHSTDDCDYECWIVTGGILKAELKFE